MSGHVFSLGAMCVVLGAIVPGGTAQGQDTGDDGLCPVVLSIAPPPGSLIQAQTTSVQVVFSKAVFGVDAADLRLTGTAAVGASVGAPSRVDDATYRFAVSGLVSGGLVVELAADASGITDASGQSLAPAPTPWAYGVRLPSSLRRLYLGLYSNPNMQFGAYDLVARKLTVVRSPLDAVYYLDSAPDGTLYGVSGPHLYTIAPGTGAATLVADLHHGDRIVDCVGFTFAPTGVAYVHELDNDGGGTAGWLYTADLATGALTRVGAVTGATSPLNALEYAAGRLYGCSFGELYTIDTTTAAATLVGTATGVADLDYGDDGIMRATRPGQRTVCIVNLLAGGLTNPTYISSATLGIASETAPDVTPPTVLGVTSRLPDGLYGTGRRIDVEVSFSEPVAYAPGDGVAQLALQVGADVRMASCTGGSGSSTLTFTYTPVPGDTAARLEYAGTGALTLSGNATLRDGARNDALLVLPLPSWPESLGGSTALAIDAIPPDVTVDRLTTGDLAPTLTGTAGDASGIAGVRVNVAAGNYDATLADGTWSVRLPAALAPGIYSVTAVATDAAGNTAADTTSSELTIRQGLWVDLGYVGTETGTRAQPYNTLGEAVAASPAKGLIRFVGDSPVTATAETLRITKSLQLRSVNGTVRIGVRNVSGSPMRFLEQVAKGTPFGTSAAATADHAWMALLLDRLKEAIHAGAPRCAGPVYASRLPQDEPASVHAPLALRVRAAEPIDPESLRVQLPDRYVDRVSAEHRLAAPGDASDLWVMVTPAEVWVPGEEIAVTVLARTASGRDLPPVSHAFLIGPGGNEPGDDPDGDIGRLQVDRGEAGAVYRIEPEEPYASPQTVWIPVPPGAGLQDRQLHYLLTDGAYDEWHPAEAVEDFLVPQSQAIVVRNGVTYLSISVRHGGTVSLRPPPSPFARGQGEGHTD